MLGLADDPENVKVIAAYSNFLQVLGHRLLPKVGVEPLGSLERARPEVQELSLLLACLATPATHPVVGPTSSTPSSSDPWHTGSDPWRACASKANGKGKRNVNVTTGFVQGFTVECARPLSCEVASGVALPLLSEFSCQTDDEIKTPLEKIAPIGVDVSVQTSHAFELADASAQSTLADEDDARLNLLSGEDVEMGNPEAGSQPQQPLQPQLPLSLPNLLGLVDNVAAVVAAIAPLHGFLPALALLRCRLCSQTARSRFGPATMGMEIKRVIKLFRWWRGIAFRRFVPIGGSMLASFSSIRATRGEAIARVAAPSLHRGLLRRRQRTRQRSWRLPRRRRRMTPTVWLAMLLANRPEGHRGWAPHVAVGVPHVAVSLLLMSLLVAVLAAFCAREHMYVYFSWSFIFMLCPVLYSSMYVLRMVHSAFCAQRHRPKGRLRPERSTMYFDFRTFQYLVQGFVQGAHESLQFYDRSPRNLLRMVVQIVVAVHLCSQWVPLKRGDSSQ
jgi:hypothetical protein